MPDHSRARIRVAAPAAALLIAWCGLFAHSVHERRDWFGHTPIGMSGWLTAGSALVAGHWRREGAWNLRFALYWAPDSVELDHAAREAYISFPPGAILPLHALALARGTPPDPALVMAWNLACQAGIALLLGFLLYRLYRRAGALPNAAGLLAAPAPLLYLYLPGPYFEHQMGYFSDHAVLFPILLFIALETRRRNGGRRVEAGLGALQAATVFLGALTDWLFFVVLGVALMWRAGHAIVQRSARPLLLAALMAAPAALALGLYLLQLHALDAFGALRERAAHRAGMSADPGFLQRMLNDGPQGWRALFHFSLERLFWTGHMPAAYGALGKWLALAAYPALAALLAWAAWARRRSAPGSAAAWPILHTAALLGLPPLLYYQAFQGHHNFLFHSFTALKFAPWIAAGVFSLLPALALTLAGRAHGGMAKAAGAILLLCAGLFAWQLQPQRAHLFDTLDPDLSHEEIGRFIAAHTDWQDVVFSPDHEIGPMPPQFIYHSGKQVHRARSVAEIAAAVEGIEVPFTINLLTLGPEGLADHPELAALAEHALLHVRDGAGPQLWKLPPEVLATLPAAN